MKESNYAMTGIDSNDIYRKLEKASCKPLISHQVSRRHYSIQRESYGSATAHKGWTSNNFYFENEIEEAFQAQADGIRNNMQLKSPGLFACVIHNNVNIIPVLKNQDNFPCENWLDLVKNNVYFTHKTHEIYQVLPYSV